MSACHNLKLRSSPSTTPSFWSVVRSSPQTVIAIFPPSYVELPTRFPASSYTAISSPIYGA